MACSIALLVLVLIVCVAGRQARRRDRHSSYFRRTVHALIRQASALISIPTLLKLLISFYQAAPTTYYLLLSHRTYLHPDPAEAVAEFLPGRPYNVLLTTYYLAAPTTYYLLLVTVRISTPTLLKLLLSFYQAAPLRTTYYLAAPTTY